MLQTTASVASRTQVEGAVAIAPTSAIPALAAGTKNCWEGWNQSQRSQQAQFRVSLASVAAAQTKISGTSQCGKLDEQYILDFGDRPGYSLAVSKSHHQYAGTGMPWGYEQDVPRNQPELVIHPSARAMLTDRMEAVLERLIPALESDARRSFVPLAKIEVTGFADPEEDTQEVVVTAWVKVSAPEALNYWDWLGTALEIWIDYLPPALADAAVERLAVEVRAETE